MVVFLLLATYTLKWPSDDDLSGAASALTRLQDTYKLDVDDLAHGQLNGVATGSVLSAHDCFELGRQSYNGGDAIHTVQWMKQALKRFEEEDKKSGLGANTKLSSHLNKEMRTLIISKFKDE